MLTRPTPFADFTFPLRSSEEGMCEIPRRAAVLGPRGAQKPGRVDLRPATFQHRFERRSPCLVSLPSFLASHFSLIPTPSNCMRKGGCFCTNYSTWSSKGATFPCSLNFLFSSLPCYSRRCWSCRVDVKKFQAHAVSLQIFTITTD